MDKRVPESFFTADLRNSAVRLLRTLSPPASGVLLRHLDAPGWVVVDLDEPNRMARRRPVRSLASAFPAGWLGPSSVGSPPSRQVDPELGLCATDDGERIWWEWEPAPRCAVNGWFPRSVGWDELRRLISRIALDMRELLSEAGDG